MRLEMPTTSEGSRRFAEWLVKMGTTTALNGAYCCGVEDDDGIVAGLSISRFHTEHDVLLAFDIRGTQDAFKFRKFLRLLQVPFNAPFNARRVTVILNAAGDRRLRLLEKFGFRKEGRLREHYGDDDGIIMGMTKSDLME